MLKYQEKLSTLSSYEREKRTWKYEAISNTTRDYIKHYIENRAYKREHTREAFAITDTHMHPVFYSTLLVCATCTDIRNNQHIIHNS